MKGSVWNKGGLIGEPRVQNTPGETLIRKRSRVVEFESPANPFIELSSMDKVGRVNKMLRRFLSKPDIKACSELDEHEEVEALHAGLM